MQLSLFQQLKKFFILLMVGLLPFIGLMTVAPLAHCHSQDAHQPGSIATYSHVCSHIDESIFPYDHQAHHSNSPPYSSNDNDKNSVPLVDHHHHCHFVQSIFIVGTKYLVIGPIQFISVSFHEISNQLKDLDLDSIYKPPRTLTT